MRDKCDKVSSFDIFATFAFMDKGIFYQDLAILIVVFVVSFNDPLFCYNK